MGLPARKTTCYYLEQNYPFRIQIADVGTMSAPRVLAEPWGPSTVQGSHQLSTTPSSLPEALLTSHPPSSPGHSDHPGTHCPHLLQWPHINLSTSVPAPCLGSIWGNDTPNPSQAESSPQASPSSDAEPVLLRPRLCSSACAPECLVLWPWAPGCLESRSCWMMHLVHTPE